MYLVEVFGLTNIFGCSLLAAASSKSLSLDQHLPFVKLKLQLDFINHVACKLLLTWQPKASQYSQSYVHFSDPRKIRQRWYGEMAQRFAVERTATAAHGGVAARYACIREAHFWSRNPRPHAAAGLLAWLSKARTFGFNVLTKNSALRKSRKQTSVFFLIII